MITIRPATKDDLKSLQELFEQYREFYSMPRMTTQSEEFLRCRLQQQDSHILMAFHERQAAGFVQVYPAFSSVAMQPLWILNDLFVNLAYRQQGIARKLMKTIELEAKRHSVFSIKLATQVNNHQAKALYDSLGYITIDKFDHYSKKL